MFQKHDFNFFLKREGQNQKSRRHLVVLGAVLIAVALAGLLAVLVSNVRLAARQTQVDELQAWLVSDTVKDKLAEAEWRELQIALLLEYRDSALRLREQIASSSAGSTRTLNTLTSLLPEGVQVETLSLTLDGIALTCTAATMEQVSALWYQLDASGLFTSPLIGQTSESLDGRISFPVTAGLNVEVPDENQ